MTESSNESIPLAQAVREFLDWQALDKGRSPNTVRAYQQDLARFLAYCAGVTAAARRVAQRPAHLADAGSRRADSRAARGRSKQHRHRDA